MFPWGVDPSQVGEVAVGGAAHHGALDFRELLRSVREGDDLGGTDKGEVEWVEEEDYILAFVVFQGDVFEHAVHDGSAFEDWGGLL